MTNKQPSVEEMMRNIPDPLTSEQYKAITQTLTAERQKRDEVVEAERERIEYELDKHISPHPLSLEDSLWLKRLLNKVFRHENT